MNYSVGGRAATWCTIAILIALVQGSAYPERGATDPPVRRKLVEKIAALKKQVAELETRVAHLARDNNDLRARLEARRQGKAGAAAPAVQGDPGILSNPYAQGTANRFVRLWDTAGGPMAGSKVVAQLVSGFPVRVVKAQRVAGREWVQCYTYHFTPGSYGWVVSDMVRSERRTTLAGHER